MKTIRINKKLSDSGIKKNTNKYIQSSSTKELKHITFFSFSIRIIFFLFIQKLYY